MSRSSNLSLRPHQYNTISMSQVPGQPAADLEDGKERDSDLELPQPELALNRPPQPSQGGSNFGDSSGPLFTMYSKIAEEEDNKVAERWQKDADGLLIFTGLFSAVIAAFLALSIPDLIPNSQDIITFYLQNIYQLQVLVASNISVPSTVATPPKFSPPKEAIWVNVLWSLSLGTSLTCALLATMIQQWARQYVSFTQSPHRTPDGRARIRAFFSSSMDKLFIKSLCTLLLSLLHLSLLLFFIGFLIFIININHVIFYSILLLSGFSMAIYSYFTALPLIRPDSMLYTPFSTFLSSLLVLVVCMVLTIFRSRFKDKLWNLFEFPFNYVGRGAEKSALARSSEIDVHILEETLKSLGDDDALEKFFEAVPGFFDSKVVGRLDSNLIEEFRTNLGQALDRFLDRTFSSDLVSKVVKNNRIVICLNASRAALDPNGLSRVLYNTLNRRWRDALQYTPVRDAPSRWDNRRFSSYLQGVVTRIVSRVPEPGDRWILLVKDELGLPERVLQDDITDGDSVSLAILVHVTRQLFQANFPSGDSNILWTLSHFDIRNTIPGLQHKFCALWNEIVLEAMNEGNNTKPITILRELRDSYDALHPDPDVVATLSSYPSCNIASHRLDSTTDSPHPLA